MARTLGAEAPAELYVVEVTYPAPAWSADPTPGRYHAGPYSALGTARAAVTRETTGYYARTGAVARVLVASDLAWQEVPA